MKCLLKGLFQVIHLIWVVYLFCWVDKVYLHSFPGHDAGHGSGHISYTNNHSMGPRQIHELRVDIVKIRNQPVDVSASGPVFSWLVLGSAFTGPDKVTSSLSSTGKISRNESCISPNVCNVLRFGSI